MIRDDMVKFAQAQGMRAPASDEGIARVRRTYALEADRIGTVPVATNAKGMATTMLQSLKGNKPAVLIDKLGERLAFERTGVRLYEALMVKAKAASTGPLLDVSALQRIRDDEESHFHMVGRYMVSLGADPTAMTPGADVAGVQAGGHLQVLTDPRTSVAQALNSILAIELADSAGWELLIELAQDAGQSEMAQAFNVALETERQHLQTVRDRLRQAVMEEAS